ncbi:unnamed protein product [Paramecium pentaurelia]|uniref:Uncharacterized protein n=1 Tax=Paramecium pentaurelia TaxID=43138 RepID=A0A8S1VLD2_9CILI|nr:unnamed protein product [Paramecium pentaurelia]
MESQYCYNANFKVLLNFNFKLILIYALAQIQVKISTENSVEKYLIISTGLLVVIGFENNKVQKPPQIKPIQQTVNLECIDQLKFILKGKKVNTNLIFGQQTLRRRIQALLASKKNNIRQYNNQHRS